jgi:hypothetical protein
MISFFSKESSKAYVK